LLKCKVQSYDWGRLGSNSSAAVLCAGGDPEFKIDEEKPYAELWMGTHKNGPADTLGDDAMPLAQYLDQHPEAYGDITPYTGGGGLPFLFKVLSIRKALSIQSHPDKKLAEELHQKDPEHYKDDNHKPEMAIALTEFEAMCGFRPVSEIVLHLEKYPELAACAGSVAQENLIAAAGDEGQVKDALRKFLDSFMNCDGKVATAQLQQLVTRLESSEDFLDGVVKRLSQQYPGDTGAMAPLFLNVLLLQPGEAFFMGANEPHAYMSGEILECMACSDNVVRAGLTPKFKDVNTLVTSLTYNASGPAVMRPDVETPADGVETRLYRPDSVKDFQVHSIRMEGGKSLKLETSASPRIVLCLNGDSTVETAKISWMGL